MADILVIDDDLQVLQLLSSTLIEKGHNISIAKNGCEGVRCLEKQSFDIVVTDIVMPEKDGIEVITYLLLRDKRPGIIAVSGGSQLLGVNYLLEMATTMKVDMVLRKPISPLNMLEAIETLLISKNII